MSETYDGSATSSRDSSVKRAPAARGGGRGVAMLALLIALIAGAASVYQTLKLRELRVATALARGQAEDRSTAALSASTAAFDKRAGDLERRLDRIAEQNEALKAALQARSGRGNEEVLAEVEYLQRLANQSLLMGREVRGAIALLESADKLLQEQDDPALHDVRAALANDLAQLRGVAAFDVEGTYLRLAALVAQIPTLGAASRDLEVVADTGTDTADEGLVAQGWRRIKALLDRYIVVRTHEEPVRPLLSMSEEQNLRMNLRLSLEQAKLALLAAEPVVFRGALGDADTWVQRYFGTRTTANRAFVDELRSLATVDVAPALPDISDSLRALRAHKTVAAEAVVKPERATPAAPTVAPEPAHAAAGD